jgi:hypothetical protein
MPVIDYNKLLRKLMPKIRKDKIANEEVQHLEAREGVRRLDHIEENKTR